MTVEVLITERPQGLIEKEAVSPITLWRGIEVDELSSVNMQRFRIREKEGVVVINVKPNSPSDAAGIIPGDVIIEINKKPVKNISDYEKTVKSISGDVLIRTIRGYFLVKSE